MTIKTEVQQLHADDMIVLYELDTSNVITGGGIYRFTERPYAESTEISFGGNLYFAVNCEATGFDYDGKGTFPRPKIRISNVNNLLTGLVVEFNDLLGSKLTRIRTFAQFLDTGSNPDGNAYMPLDIYYVDQKTDHNNVYIEWAMSSVLEQTGQKIPGRIIMRDICMNTYRFYQNGAFVYSDATCPYTGGAMFDENDNSVTSPGKDICSRRLTGCQARYGAKKVLPFGGFPGVNKS